MAYQLYHNKNEIKIEIKSLRKCFENCDIGEEITRFNQNYYFCKTRIPLNQLAIEIKQQWIKEAEETLQKIKCIPI